MKIDVYRVGAFKDFYMAWRALTVRPVPLHQWRYARRYLKRPFQLSAHYIRVGKWRELKNQWNGFLAEPTPWPTGATRCGSGWTRKRALRSLRRQVSRPGVSWDATVREIEIMLGWRSGR